MRSALLYYRKHHGRLGAWSLARLEMAWHTLRRLKAAVRPATRAKAEESRRVAVLMRRAWQEALGGRVSPTRPW
jgi:hypothetical protein